MRTRLDPTTLASVGTVAKMTSGEGVPGNDVALIRIDPAVAAKWGVNPAVPVVGGPNGIYAGCGHFLRIGLLPPNAGRRGPARRPAEGVSSSG